MMLSVQSLRVQYGARVLFQDLSFSLQGGGRLALAGPNGAGKSTLMKCICREVKPDAGTVVMPKHARVGYLPQEGIHKHGVGLLAEAMNAFADVIELQHTVDTLAAKLHHTDPRSSAYSTLLDEIGEAELILQAHDTARLRPRAESILRGLGFKDKDFERDCGEFSGGWQMRIALAKLLLREPEVLLLDEPTNHLDLQSQQWMEQYLRGYKGAIILISHDVALLDGLVTRTIAFHHGRAEEYAGNFSFFLKESVLRKEILMRQKKSQDREIAKSKEFIDRFRAKASKASLVQSRMKQLDKIERIEIESDDANVQFRFPPPPPSGHVVVRLKDVVKCYGQLKVFEDFSFEIEKGDRIAIVGVNGAGKSTFSRLISGTEQPTEGLCNLGYNTSIAFFSQTHADDLEPSQTVLESIETIAREATREPAHHARTLLGAFLFRGDDVFKPVGVLSGGERSRVALARMLLKPANFLILDEPTNHLDVQSQAVLQQALLHYQGTYCIVSHNRHFLDPIVNKVLEFIPGAAPRLFLGNVSDYLEKLRMDALQGESRLAGARRDPQSSGQVPVVAEQDRKARRRHEAALRAKRTQVLKPKQMELEAVEERISKIEAKKAQLTEQMSAPDQDADALVQLAFDFKQAEADLEHQFTRWESLSTAIAALEEEVS